MSLQTTRREVLKAATVAAITLAVPISAQKAERRRWAMYIDVNKCYGCYACMVACAAENNVPVGVFRTWIERHVTKGGTVIFVPKQCNHCENAPCVKPCPTGATYKRVEDGLVLVNDELCIGCGACIQACPYGARFFNPVKGVVDKCTFCEHRIYQGKLPACVETCPTGARVFGDLNDPESPVSKIIKANPTQRLKIHTGAEPMIFYKDLPSEANL
ncbi:4Fe-4S dicluster domain-containing protein [Pyrobaculum arsenaticum]|uniref:Tetrathionate reductase beta subunit n=2 Tax=Pyrobaculum TaxID=2276 RepID=A4WHX2_PYRAR|nr:4Fe-4S dicluster domain-containing protein [Pyrobaculum arsenaticum]ABP49989.1 tetrathionate reductase beta subunit [Pyrobaculum arsenaticum DSM 13514]